MDTPLFTIPSEQQTVMDRVLQLYEQGKYIQAYRSSGDLGPLGKWPGAPGRLLAGRLAGNLGRRGWSVALMKLAGREYPNDPRAVYFSTSAFLETHGPLLCWRRMKSTAFPVEGVDDDTHASWLGLHATVLGSLRDFDHARSWIEQAHRVSPNNPWILTLHSALAQMQDQRDAAWEWADQALRVQPWFRPAVDQHLGLLLDRGDRHAALELLNQALVHLESLRMMGAKIRILMDLGRYDDAWNSLQDLTQMDVLHTLSGIGESWLNSLRCDLAVHLGQWSQGAEFARAIPKSEFYKELAERLEKAVGQPISDEPTRVQLQVPFVRQMHRTCAPATLAGLTAYFGLPIAHEEIVNRICYDGTAAHDERSWAEQNGFLAREFRVTLETAETLIRANIPFALTTIGVETGHLQTVVGFDSIRGVLLIQDPGSSIVDEVAATAFLEYFASSGPRGMVMVPEGQADRLAGIELPEAELYDLQYQVDTALDRHDRSGAQEVVDRMQQIAEGHRLTLQCLASLARYDGNDTLRLKYLSALQQLYPNDLRLLLMRFAGMGDHSNRAQRIAELQRLYNEKGPHPAIAARLAEEWMDDARMFGEAGRLLRRATRHAGPHAGMASALSRWSWNQGDKPLSLDYARFAACLDDRNESRVSAYFRAACNLHQEGDVIQWLRRRTEPVPLQGDPYTTLSWAFEQLQRSKDSIQALEDGIAALPDDGMLLAYAAYKMSAYGQIDRARALLDQAHQKCSEAVYRRTAASIELDAGNLRLARDHLERVAAIDPLDMGTVERLLQIDADLDGSDVARVRLDRLLEKFPTSYALRATNVAWVRQNQPALAAEVVDSMLRDSPDDAWTIREAAIFKMQCHDWQEANDLLAQAIALEPQYSRNWFLLGKCQQELGRFADAKASYRKTIECSVDDTLAMKPWLDLCATPEQRREVLDFIYQELVRQTTYGDGISGYYELASGRMPFEELVDKLQGARRERGDLPQSWTCLIDVLCRLNRIDEAIEIARQATGLFPLHIQSWLDLAQAQRTAGDLDACQKTLEHAQTIGVTNANVARQLSELHRSRKDWQAADAVLAKALEANPRDGVLIAFRAETLWDLGQPQDAIDTMRKALVLLPNYDWAWNTLSAWCRERQQLPVLRDTARALIEARPRQVRGFLRLADASIELSDIPAALETIEEALKIDVRCIDAYFLKAWALSIAGQHQAALDATSPEVFRDAPSPPLLLTRSDLLASQGNLAAAIESRREAVQLDPDNYVGWRRLMAWTDNQAHAEIHEEAARNCVRIAPENVDGYGCLAGALIAKGDSGQAKALLGEALQREPGYEYAAQTLFDLQMKDNETQAAEQTLERTRSFVAKELSWSMSIRLLLQAGKEDEAFEKLKSLGEAIADSPTANWGLILLTVDLWANRQDLFQRCQREIMTGNGSEALGRIWAHLRLAVNPSEPLLKDLKRIPDSKGWDGAVEYLLKQEDERLMPLADSEAIRRRFHQRLLRKAELWSALGFNFIRHSKFKETVAWCHRWRSVPNIQRPGQWYPGVLSAWFEKQPEAARPWVQSAVRLPDDEYANTMRLWAALDAMLRASPDQAGYWLSRVDLSTVDEWFIDAYRLVAWYIHTYAPERSPMRQSDLRKELRRNRISGLDADKLPGLRKRLGRILASRANAWLDWLLA